MDADRTRPNRRAMPRRRTVALSVAMMMSTAACGGGGEPASEAAAAPATTATSAPPATGPTTNPATTSTVTPDTTAPASDAPSAPSTSSTTGNDTPGRRLESVVATAPVDDAWPLAAGRWVSTAFDPPLTFELPPDLRLNRLAPSYVELLGPTGQERYIITIPNAVYTGRGGKQALPDDLVAFLQGVPSVTELSSSTMRTDDDRDALIVDFVIDPLQPQAGFGCVLGDRCLGILQTLAGPDIDVLAGEPVRTVLRPLADREITLIAIGTATADVELAASTIAEVAASLADAGPLEPVDGLTDGPVLLGTHGTRLDHLPAGTHVVQLGDVGVTVDAEAELDGIGLRSVGDRTVEFDIGDTGSLKFIRPNVYLDPASPQSGYSLDGAALLDPTPTTYDEVIDWLASTFVLGEPSTIDVGNTTATSWPSEGFADGVEPYSCDLGIEPGRIDECRNLAVTDGFLHLYWSDPGGGNWFFVEPHGLILQVGPNDAADTFEDTLAAAAPLLDRITIGALHE